MASTTNHSSHCSTYLRESIHRATMESELARLSTKGTVLFVNVVNTQYIAPQIAMNTPKMSKMPL